jgi:hypothetical protein
MKKQDLEFVKQINERGTEELSHKKTKNGDKIIEGFIYIESYYRRPRWTASIRPLVEKNIFIKGHRRRIQKKCLKLDIKPGNPLRGRDRTRIIGSELS